MKEFGVLILTYPGDFHLSKVLIRSLEHFNPDIPIAIIPGTGFSLEDHPFKGYEIVQPPKRINKYFPDHYDRKFWAFFSPFEKFLYCDSDVICLRNFSKEIGKLIDRSDQFILANLPNRDYGFLKDSKTDDRKRKIDSGGQLGQLNRIRAFDPDYDYYQNYLINSGLFLSSSSTFDEDVLIEFRKQEIDFYKEKLGKDFRSNSLYDLFYGDQGRLNYLIYKQKIKLETLFPFAHYQWGGKAFNYELNSLFDGGSHVPFIHWAGCPKPSHSIFTRGSLFRVLIKSYGNLDYTRHTQKEVPAQNFWAYMDESYSLANVVKDSKTDFVKFVLPYIKRSIRKMI